MLIDPLIVIRAIHFAAAILVAGSVAFCAFVAGPALRRAGGEARELAKSFGRQNARVLSTALFVAVVSGAAWLVLVAGNIAGEPWRDVIGDGTAWAVLRETQFGFVAQLRLLMAAALAMLLFKTGARQPSGWLRNLAVATAALFLGSLAWAGHASAGLGIGGALHLANDVIHLLAAGAWVGGLAALLLFLGEPGLDAEAQGLSMAGEVLHRFSMVGIASVAALAASGTINTWFLTDHLRALPATDYGRLVQVKIGLFLVMFSLATVNRMLLLPQLSGSSDGAGLQRARGVLRQLRRSAAIEFALGLGAICVVAVLGITPPAGHIHSAWAALAY
jgi:putative copper resistance protein D